MDPSRFRHIGATAGLRAGTAVLRPSLPSGYFRAGDLAVGRPIFDMGHYRQVLVRQRPEDTDREITRFRLIALGWAS